MVHYKWCCRKSYKNGYKQGYADGFNNRPWSDVERSRNDFWLLAVAIASLVMIAIGTLRILAQL